MSIARSMKTTVDYLLGCIEGDAGRFSRMCLADPSKKPIDEATETTQFAWALDGDSACALGMAFAALKMFRQGGTKE